nr:protein late bloomer-like [Drosophila bipectinata]
MIPVQGVNYLSGSIILFFSLLNISAAVRESVILCTLSAIFLLFPFVLQIFGINQISNSFAAGKITEEFVESFYKEHNCCWLNSPNAPRSCVTNPGDPFKDGCRNKIESTRLTLMGLGGILVVFVLHSFVLAIILARSFGKKDAKKTKVGRDYTVNPI